MRYHWLIDQSELDNLCIYWDKGDENFADYHTKHFPPAYHRNVRPNYILKGHHIKYQHDSTHLPTLEPEQYLRARVCLLPGTSTLGNKLHTSNDVHPKCPLQFKMENSLTAIFG